MTDGCIGGTANARLKATSQGRAEDDDRCRPLSAAMIRVLHICADYGGTASIKRLVGRSQRSRSVARPSVSRTLRRLWVRGLVELEDEYGRTLTQHLADIDGDLRTHQRDPELAFEAARRAPGFCPFANSGDYLAWYLAQRERRRRNHKMCRARLTQKARQILSAVNFKSPGS
jgi:hypothetical protein